MRGTDGPVDVLVLGQVTVRAGGRAFVPSGLIRGLVGVLALTGADGLTDPELTEAIWGQRTDEVNRSTVAVAVHRARRWLGDTVGDRLRIDRTATGFALVGGQVDAEQFLRACAAAASQPDRSRVDTLAGALRLWRGEPLVGVEPAGAVVPVIQRLALTHLHAVADYGQVLLRLGRPAAAVTAVLRAAEREPLDETLHAVLIEALAADGRRTEALHRYENIRRRLADELGVDPSRQLSDAHVRVLRDETVRRAASDAGERRCRLGPRGHLTQLVGREAELTELARLLAQRRLVTVAGTAGCGKTALALRAAEDHHGDVAVLALAPLSREDELPLALATLLGVRGVSTDAALDAAAAALAAPGQLLVVDNAEHLAGAAARLVIRLLGSCPALTVLVTSRHPLGVSEELTWPLAPLGLPADGDSPDAPAARLFRQRARQALPSVDLSDTDAIGRVCRRVDGLPLALELAAARVRTLAVPQLADRLDGNLGLLFTLAAPNGDPRHRTLHEAIDWSYRLLGADERRALAHLSVFRVGFTIHAADAVSDVADVVVAISGLVDSSLLVVDVAGGTQRYRMLETVRDHAATRLDESGERAATEHRHLAHWLDRADALTAVTAFADRVAQARDMAADLPDAEAALVAELANGHEVEAIDLANRLHDCWNVNPGYPARGAHWLSIVDSVEQRCPPRLRAEARLRRGQLLGMLGPHRQAAPVLRQAMADADAVAPVVRADLLAVLVQCELSCLDPAALANTTELTAAAERLDDKDLHAAALDAAINVALEWNQLDRAAELVDRLAEVVTPSLAWVTPLLACHQAMIAARRGDEPAVRAALARAAEAESPASSAARDYGLRQCAATALLAVDRPAEARDYLQAEIDRLAAIHPDVPLTTRLLRIPYAEALRRTGSTEPARQALADGLDAARTSGRYRAGLPALLTAAATAQDLNDCRAAECLATGWESTRRRLGLPLPIGYHKAAQAVGVTDQPPEPAETPFELIADSVDELLDQATSWCRATKTPGTP